MMYNRIVLLFSLFLSGGLAAQEKGPSDSLYCYGQSVNELTMAHSGATHLVFGNYQSTAQAQLYAGREQGSFRRAAEAYQSMAVGFQTEGLKKQGRFYLGGKFVFQKSWEDSAAWSHQGEFNEAQPYYFFAGKAGRYERQLYHLQATVAYNLWKDRIFLGASGRYRYHWTTRSVDPRPDVKALSFAIRPEITFRYKSHLAGVGFHWARGSETNDIAYKNRNYAGNQLFLDRNNFMSLGFGHIGKIGTMLNRYNEASGVFANYAVQVNNWKLQASADYELWQEDISIREPSTRQQHDLYAFLQQDKLEAKLLASHEGKNVKQQWLAHLTAQSLLNWASEFGATSYQFTGTEAGLSYSQLRGLQGKTRIELGAGILWSDRFKEDVVAAHRHQRQMLTPHLSLTYYRKLKDGGRFSAGITPSYRLTLRNEIAVPPTQENYFTQGIFYTDYLYWQKNAVQLETKLGYLFSGQSAKNRLGCTVTLHWQGATGGESTNLPALYQPHGSRWGAAASVILYL